MTKTTFEYHSYIYAAPLAVWNALTDPEMTKRYWGHHRNASDWSVGSVWRHQDYDDETLVDFVGKVVEFSPPRRLVLTWAAPRDERNPDRISRVAFDLEPVMGAVRLKVTHEDLEINSEMLDTIKQHWPAVLSGMKTLLETGRPMPMSETRPDAHSRK